MRDQGDSGQSGLSACTISYHLHPDNERRTISLVCALPRHAGARLVSLTRRYREYCRSCQSCPYMGRRHFDVGLEEPGESRSGTWVHHLHQVPRRRLSRWRAISAPFPPEMALSSWGWGLTVLCLASVQSRRGPSSIGCIETIENSIFAVSKKPSAKYCSHPLCQVSKRPPFPAGFAGVFRRVVKAANVVRSVYRKTWLIHVSLLACPSSSSIRNEPESSVLRRAHLPSLMKTEYSWGPVPGHR